MTQYKYIIFSSLLFTACAQAPKQPEAHTHTHAHVEQPVQEEEPAAVLPNVELSKDILYQYLLSEIASQRGLAGIAAEGSVDLARRTRDPRLAMRAAQLAIQAGQMDRAVEAIKVWREVEPDSPVAMRMLSAALLRSGRLDEARQ